MDLKYKFQREQGNSINRNNQTANQMQLGRNHQQKLGGGSSSQAGGLNRFKKKTEVGSAPAGQFKKYMVEANNIFY